MLLFPGQGSQFVGMGQDLLQYPNVPEMYALASEILGKLKLETKINIRNCSKPCFPGYDLLKLCLEGPQSELDKTIHCQPAVLVTSLAAVEKLRHENPQV